MGGWAILGITVGVISILPIWRIAGSKQGYTAWQAFASKTKHITAEEAIRHAREAYCECEGGISPPGSNG